MYNDNGGSYGQVALTVNDNGYKPSNYSKGCEWLLVARSNHYVTALNSPTDLTFSNAAVTCTATTTTVSVTASNGVGALTFLITGTTSAASNFGPITTAGSSVAADFPNLLPGIIPLE
jgi:hypothetical protein